MNRYFDTLLFTLLALVLASTSGAEPKREAISKIGTEPKVVPVVRKWCSSIPGPLVREEEPLPVEIEHIVESQSHLDSICGQDRRSRAKRIDNGSQILKAHHWPWQASLYAVRTSLGYMFGGAVISRKWILTAAHGFKMVMPELPELSLCLSLPSTWEVRVGEELQGVSSLGVQKRSVISILIHPDYVNKSHDVALLKLDRPLHFGSQVQPLCLPPPVELPDLLKHQCYLSGYPTQGDTGSPYQEILLPLWTHERCSSEEFLGPEVTPSMLCAGHEDGGPDACRGDSGRPLMCLTPGRRRWMATGLVSWGKGCGVKRKPGVYTRVRSYLPWIRKQVFG